MAETTTLVTAKRLEGKVVVITGGASGIGESTARLFSTHGPRVIIIADVQDDLGQDVAISFGQHVCTYIPCDVSDESQVKLLIDLTAQKYGRVDVMFNNAAKAMVSCGVRSIVCTTSAAASIGSEQHWGSGHSFDCDAYGMDVKGIETMFSSACSLKGVALNVKHVSDAVLFLASDESTFVSGLNLAVDSCFRLSALA
ncbi:hypothetical protein GIB67_032935 [Kingdonia uniflora]|uniref:Uncharacterized protein n=1 Tax=Kingdonia uniflora TaxID=39325 RepID=A0A7J7MY35_9MAGN|nr:hypothetical protein GIB67_032935 [Kingdonia uniflora]